MEHVHDRISCLLVQDDEGELQLQRQSLLCRKKVSAFDLSRSGQMCGTGTMDGAPIPTF